MFDREKVLTPFTADKAKVGDVGWIAQTLEGIALQAQNQNDSISCDLIKVNSDIRKIGERFAFLGRRGGENVKGNFFYPAPYEYMQARWVEEVGLKVGDKVRIVREWERGERGVDIRPLDWDFSGATFEVSSIWSWGIQCEFKGFWEFPYFALEKVTEEYRPFANAEEFKHYREGWWQFRTSGVVFKVDTYQEDGVYVPGEEKRVPFDVFLDKYTNADTGEPAGVKL